MHAQNREHAFTTLFNLFLSLTDSRSPFFPVKHSVVLNSDRKPRACEKLGNGPGVGKCPAPGRCKLCQCPTPGTDKAGKCPAVTRGGGLGAGGMAHFTVTGANEAGVDLLLIQPILLYYVNQVVVMLTIIFSFP